VPIPSEKSPSRTELPPSNPRNAPPARSTRDRKRIEFLEKKVQTKDEVLAELMAEHIALKRFLGSFDQELGAA
jgi:hypothetical protein